MTAGARVRMWKQDPSVAGMADRKVLLVGRVDAGPSDARIVSGFPGIPPVQPDANGDFIEAIDTPAFDAVHTFAVVRQTVDMYERALSIHGCGEKIRWAWNTNGDTSPLALYPHGLADTKNAYYDRFTHSLKFGHFVPANGGDRIYSCRSLDVVAHEAAHAILDGFKPNWMRAKRNAQTGALHEAFGDLTAILLVLSQFDLLDALMVDTGGDLRSDSFLTRIAEQFGAAIGLSDGLRNAENTVRLSLAGSDVHALSRAFTGAVYDSMVDIFEFERAGGGDAIEILHQVGVYMRALLLRAYIASPDAGAGFADVMGAMLAIVESDKKPAQYQNFIRERFMRREIDVVLPGAELVEAGIAALTDDVDHSACCYTMRSEVSP